MRTIIPKTLLITLCTAFCSSVVADEHLVSQKSRQFSPPTMTVKVGESVIFVNDDIVRHNVFSLSRTQSFNLETFPPGQSRTVMMAKPGVIDIECAIHPDMKMQIKVVK